jgi:hypothetical protein
MTMTRMMVGMRGMTGTEVGTMTHTAGATLVNMTNPIGILGLAIIGASTMARTGVAIMIGTRDAITIGTKGILGTAIVLGIRTMVGMAVGIKGLP